MLPDGKALPFLIQIIIVYEIPVAGKDVGHVYPPILSYHLLLSHNSFFDFFSRGKYMPQIVRKLLATNLVFRYSHGTINC